MWCGGMDDDSLPGCGRCKEVGQGGSGPLKSAIQYPLQPGSGESSPLLGINQTIFYASGLHVTFRLNKVLRLKVFGDFSALAWSLSPRAMWVGDTLSLQKSVGAVVMGSS